MLYYWFCSLHNRTAFGYPSNESIHSIIETNAFILIPLLYNFSILSPLKARSRAQTNKHMERRKWRKPYAICTIHVLWQPTFRTMYNSQYTRASSIQQWRQHRLTACLSKSFIHSFRRSRTMESSEKLSFSFYFYVHCTLYIDIDYALILKQAQINTFEILAPTSSQCRHNQKKKEWPINWIYMHK